MLAILQVLGVLQELQVLQVDWGQRTPVLVNEHDTLKWIILNSSLLRNTLTSKLHWTRLDQVDVRLLPSDSHGNS